MNVNILGTRYKIIETNDIEDDRDGSCDRSVHVITVRKEWPQRPNTIADISVYKKQLLRHEMIHAFLFESGLVVEGGLTEEQVDWLAIQWTKLTAAFVDAGCLD